MDLRRILSGYEVDGAPFSTTMERTMITAVETIAKSIPASIIATLEATIQTAFIFSLNTTGQSANKSTYYTTIIATYNNT